MRPALRAAPAGRPAGLPDPFLHRGVAPRALAALVAVFLGLPGVAAAAPGGLDATFGTGGSGVTSLASGTQLYGVAVQADREVVATGSSGSSLLVERFSASGAAEGSFAAGSGTGRAVVVQPDGKIVVAGNDSAGMVVERFNADGSLDMGFGSHGVVHAFPGGRANAVALGPGATIVAAGQVSGADGFQRVALLGLKSDGSTDLGPAVIDLGQDSVARGVAVQGDGKILLAGSIGPGTHQTTTGFLQRLTSSATGDTSFNGTSIVAFPPQSGGGDATINAVALDPAGGIIVGGGSTATNESLAVFARLTCSGGPDSGFAGGEKVTPSSATFFTQPVGANGVVAGPGGRTIGAGEFRNSGVSSAAISGFEPNGTPDFMTLAPGGAEANAVVLDSTGALVVAGSNNPPGFAPSGFVARYTGFGAPASGSGQCGGSVAPAQGKAPSVTTGGSSSITATRARVSGSVNPNSEPTTYYFAYGKSTRYGAQSSTTSGGSGAATINVSATLSGLSSGTTYHYRLVASNAAGVSYGADRTFRTSSAARPALSKLSQSHRRWRESGSRRGTVPVGTAFSFVLNERARVVFAFTQTVRGRRVRRRCVKPTAGNRSNPSCKLTVTRARLTFTGHAGRNKRPFTGKISRSKQLAPGTYRLVVTARNGSAKGRRSSSVTFTIVGR